MSYSQFWELNLCSEELALCFKNYSIFFVAIEVKAFYEYNKTVNVRSLGKTVIFISPETYVSWDD